MSRRPEIVARGIHFPDAVGLGAENDLLLITSLQ
jgi:hypothetical protein